MLVAVYTIAIFVSAALLFLIQPLFARMILPELGGTPAAWNTALVFYQATLLAGYYYAHVATRRLGVRRQAAWHLGVLLIPLAVLPIAVRRLGEAPVEGTPVIWLLATLALSVGLPFFVVSASSPLLQRWFSRTGHRRAHDPYFLYAASNLGSFVGLFAYPFAIEPYLTLQVQAVLWTVGYVGIVLLTAACAWLLFRAPLVAEHEERSASPRPSGLRKARWVMLAFVPSALMMGVTTFLSTDVAAIPLLWALPLGVYLLTFMAAFARRSWVPLGLLAVVSPPVLLVALVTLVAPLTKPGWLLAGAGLLAFVLGALACHAELARDRPGPEHLTGFFLFISLGGVLGGVFCGLLAPVVFDRVLEYPIALVLGLALVPALLAPKEGKRRVAWLMDVSFAVGVAALTWGSYALVRSPGLELPVQGAWVPLAIPTVVCTLFLLRPQRVAWGAAGMSAVAVWMGLQAPGVLYQSRDFFGMIRVTDYPTIMQRQFVHGTTVHAVQSTDATLRRKPVGYYHFDGPMGDAFDKRPRPQGARVGIVGLGAGAVAAYARPGETWTFYEIDPAVVKVAKDKRLFTYLEDMRAPYTIVLGDARLQMSRSDERYDILVLAAYSSAAVPVHLLTREALRMYVSRLLEGGFIAMHIGNRYLELEPVVARLAQDAGLVARVKADNRVGPLAMRRGVMQSLWAVLARSEADLGIMNPENGWWDARLDPRVPLWTDDYSSVVSVLKALR